MAITIPAVGRATLESLIALIIQELNSSQITQIENESNGTPQLINGSFEDYASVLSVNVPLNWTQTILTGGSYKVDTSVFAHGIASVNFTAPGGSGNGGGYIQSTDFLPISPYLTYGLQGLIKSDVIGMINRVRLYWFNSAQNAATTPYTEIYESTTTPSAWGGFIGSGAPPSDACFVQVRLIGGDTGSPAGNTWFDGVQFFNPITQIVWSLNQQTPTYSSQMISMTSNINMTLPEQYSGSNGYIKRPVRIIIDNSQNPNNIEIYPGGTDLINSSAGFIVLTAGSITEVISNGFGNWVQV